MTDEENTTPEPTAATSPDDDEAQSTPSELPAQSELERAQEDAAKFKDMLVRTTADFDNFRKRTRRELEDARRSGREDLLKDLLPVFDNLERAIQSAQKATEVKAVSEGLSMILKQFESTLGRANIGRVPTVGVMFDPSLHEAIQQIETDEQPPGTVVAEVQPGYREGERLVRAAMVVVAKPKSS
jgi:molecular chaperone GrpE